MGEPVNATLFPTQSHESVSSDFPAASRLKIHKKNAGFCAFCAFWWLPFFLNCSNVLFWYEACF